MIKKIFIHSVLFIGIFSSALFVIEKIEYPSATADTNNPQTLQNTDELFLNESSTHHFDRSLKLSIKLAQERSHIQNAVILLKAAPENKTIESLAAELFQKYQIGKNFSGKGILFLYLEKEKQLKIEVSYDLEGAFPDVICHRLEEGARTFMLTGNQRDFFTELLVTMNLHYLKKDYKSFEELEFPFAQNSFALSNYLSGGAGAVGRNYSDAIEARKNEITKLSADLVNRFQPSTSAEETLQKYLQSLQSGIGDEQLPLLTDGSQIFRMENPKTPGYVRRQYQYYQEALPYHLSIQGEIAAALFKPNHPVLPILLRKSTDGKWFVDESRMWAENHLFENNLDPVQKYSNNPFHFAWIQSKHPQTENILYKDYTKSKELEKYQGDYLIELQRLEGHLKQSTSAKNYFALADFIYFESYWISAAIPLVEKGIALDPNNQEYRWRLIDLYMNNADYEQMLFQFRALTLQNPTDNYLKTTYHFYLKMFETTDQEVADFPQTSQNLAKSVYSKETSFQVSQTPKEWPPKKFKSFPEIYFKDIHGSEHQISELKGRWVLIEPIGMNCPACLAFSGAHRKGTLENISPQSDLLAIDQYLLQTGVDLNNEKIFFVQLLLYDLRMKAPTIKDAELWRKKFDFGKGDLHWVISGDLQMINQDSYNMIPGYFLLDPNGVVVADSTGHNPVDNLFTTLIPTLKSGLEQGQKISQIKGPSLESIIQKIEMTPELAYKKIPHRRTLFRPSESPLDEASKNYVNKLLNIADTAVALRVKLLEISNSENNQSKNKLIAIYDDLITQVNESNEPSQNPALKDFKQNLVLSLSEHKEYFKELTNNSRNISSNLQTNSHIQKSSQNLHAAYQKLMEFSPNESENNKAAFFDYLCALDFI